MNLYILIFMCVGLSTGTLGKKKRIIGGVKANIRDYPYMVSIRYNSLRVHYCGGAIITQQHILTAAHCVNNRELDKMWVYTGSNYSVNKSGQEQEVQTVDMHPNFTGDRPPTKGSQHDIAIITLKRDIVFTRTQMPGILEKNDVQPGNIVEIIGWGQTKYPATTYSDSLQKAVTKIITNKGCLRSIALPIYDGHICTIGNGKIGVCVADSGSPLIVHGKIVGIASFCIPCARGYPDVFTRISLYSDFINSIINK